MNLREQNYISDFVENSREKKSFFGYKKIVIKNFLMVKFLVIFHTFFLKYRQV